MAAFSLKKILFFYFFIFYSVFRHAGAIGVIFYSTWSDHARGWAKKVATTLFSGRGGHGYGSEGSNGVGGGGTMLVVDNAIGVVL